MKKIVSVIVLIVLSFAQTNRYFHDAKTISMAGATVSLAETQFAVFTNPAALASQEGGKIATNVIIPFYSLDLFKIGSMTGSFHIENYGMLAVSAEFLQVSYEKHILQSENSYIFSHGFTLMKDVSTSLDFGYNLRMYQLIFNNFSGMGTTEKTSNVLIDISFRATIYHRFSFGAFVKNIGNKKVGLDNSQELLREFQIGIGYVPYDGVTTTFDLSKEIGFDNRYHFGLDYRVFQNSDIDFRARFGVVSGPNQFSFGFALHYGELAINYGAMSHQIGTTHQFGISYEL